MIKTTIANNNETKLVQGTNLNLSYNAEESEVVFWRKWNKSGQDNKLKQNRAWFLKSTLKMLRLDHSTVICSWISLLKSLEIDLSYDL